MTWEIIGATSLAIGQPLFWFILGLKVNGYWDD